MTALLQHRGPDGEGFYHDRHAHLGHRRLSIIDVAAGHQPMSNEAGNSWIVYNGEVFNHADLRPDLERAGHRYQTRCDTETILHAYEEYGPDCVSRFRGMFAFAIWDRDARRLFCARDRLGIKPFYYYWDGRLFAFASEIKALLLHPQIGTALAEGMLPEYTAFGYGSGEATLYSKIFKLMPGHRLSLQLGNDRQEDQLTIEQYWDLPEPTGESRSDQEWISECRQRLEEAVRTRLMSDVPLGMFLSGGLDSSAIAALMKHMVSGPVKTFAVGYGEDEYSELAYARQVAGHLGTEHHEVKVGMEDFFQAVPKLIWHEDEPLVWPSSVSLYFVARLASESVKVVLTGEGSDELFAGYGRYHFYLRNAQALKAYGLLPRVLREGSRRWIASTTLLSAGLRRRLQHTFLGAGEGFESLYLDNFLCAFPESVLGQYWTRRPAGAPPAYDSYLHYWNARKGRSPLSRMLYADQKTYLLELLMKQDQMSMAASIESRVPFLDHPFVEFAARVPDRLKLHGRTEKYILKEAVGDLLPPDIIHRKKMGFPTPLRAWLGTAKARPLFDLLSARDGILASYFDLHAVEKLVERHQSGFEDATERLWRLINLQMWGEVCLLGRREQLERKLALVPTSLAVQ